jgi:hypothetical protein
MFGYRALSVSADVGTGTSSGQGSALMIASWWQSEHDTASDRTPCWGMLPSP